MPRPLPQIAGVILDMDGLMLDTESIYMPAWQRAANELGYVLDDASYHDLIGLPTATGEEAVARKFGPQFPLDTFRAAWPPLWRAAIERDGIPWKRGLAEFLDFVDAQRLPMAVATSSDRDYAEFTLRHGGLAERFKVVVTVDQVAHAKPAPDLYIEAAHRLGVAPEQCVALEDSDAGIVAAARAGTISLLIPDLKPPSADAAAAAYRVLPSLNAARDVLAALLRSI